MPEYVFLVAVFAPKVFAGFLVPLVNGISGIGKGIPAARQFREADGGNEKQDPDDEQASQINEKVGVGGNFTGKDAV